MHPVPLSPCTFHPVPPLPFIVNIYPNPTDGFLTVSIPSWREEGKGEIRIYDSAGRNLYSRQVTGKKEIIDLSGYAAGMYIAEISIDGKTGTYKIVKDRK